MGLTILDAGVIIGFLDAGDTHHGAAIEVFKRAGNGGDSLAVPASAFAEVLVGPARKGEAAIAEVQRFVATVPIDVIPADADIAVEAARLRARYGAKLRLPDALVIATARARRADLLVTTDRGWPTAGALGLVGELTCLEPSQGLKPRTDLA